MGSPTRDRTDKGHSAGAGERGRADTSEGGAADGGLGASTSRRWADSFAPARGADGVPIASGGGGGNTAATVPSTASRSSRTSGEAAADRRRGDGGGGGDRERGGGGGGADGAAAAAGSDSVPQEVRNAFAYYDRDRSGSIDARELSKMLDHLGIDATTQEAREVLKLYDSDRSRTLELPEFARLVHDVRMPSAATVGDTAAGSGSRARAPSSAAVCAGGDTGGGAAGSRRSFGANPNNKAPPDVYAPPPPPTPCGPSNTGAAAHRPTVSSPLRSSFDLSSSMRGGGGGGARPGTAGSGRSTATDLEKRMAVRMRDMASDIASALKENEADGKHAPPLALAYRHAVERRDEEDVRLRGGY